MSPLPCDFIYIDAFGNTQTVTLTDGNPVFICSAITPVGIDGCTINVINTGDPCIDGFCPGCNCYLIEYEIVGPGDYDINWDDCQIGSTGITLFSFGYLQGSFNVCSSTVPTYFDPGNPPGTTISFSATLGQACYSADDCPPIPTPTPTPTVGCPCWEVNYTIGETGFIVYNECEFGNDAFYTPPANTTGVVYVCSLFQPTGANGLIINSAVATTQCIFNPGLNVYECDNITPTPSSTPTSTPTPTPTPTPTEIPLCDCYHVYNQNEVSVPFTYTDCSGNTVNDSIGFSEFIPICGSNVVSQAQQLLIVLSGTCVDGQCPVYCWDVRNVGTSPCNVLYWDYTVTEQTVSVPSGETISVCSYTEPAATNFACAQDIQIFQLGVCTNGICPCPYCSEYEFIVSQNDLDSATGNTDPSNDNVVFLDYVPCGLLTQVDLSFNTAGIYGPYCINENFNYYYGYIKDDISILGPDVLVDSVLNKTGCCCDCQYVSFNISQGDLNNFTGNTNPAFPNNTIIFGYADCNGVQRKLYINTAGIYQDYICASVIQNELTAGFNGYQDDSPWLGSFESTFEFSGCCNESNCICYETITNGDTTLTFTPCSGITETIGGGTVLSVCSITLPTTNDPNGIIYPVGICTNNATCPTPQPTPTPIPSVIPCECFEVDVTITQQDLNTSSGNTALSFYDNHTIYLAYTNCQGNNVIQEYTVAGTYLADACVSSAYTILRLYYVRDNWINVNLSTYTPNYSDCCTPPLAPVPPAPIPTPLPSNTYVFESCCTGEVFTAGPYPGILLNGETYYLTTDGFDGCAIINDSLTPTNNYVGYTATLYADCDDCKLNHPC